MPLDMVNAAAEELEVSMDKYASEYVGGRGGQGRGGIGLGGHGGGRGLY